MEGTRVESAGEVAFGKVEKTGESYGDGGNEESRESGGGAVMCLEGRSRGANSSKSEGD